MEPKTILAVEDSDYLAASISDMLAMRGYNPIVASTGREGVAIALEQHPDLILLDIRLPDIDGYEVYRQIRNDEWGKDAKIMVLTASESTETISKNVDLPPENVLFKPEMSVQEILEKIESLLR